MGVGMGLGKENVCWKLIIYKRFVNLFIKFVSYVKLSFEIYYFFLKKLFFIKMFLNFLNFVKFNIYVLVINLMIEYFECLMLSF